ncbi:MAG: hypothetical protein WCD31_09225 [Gillisia sp.]
MEKFMEELEDMDSKENHLKVLDKVLLAYLLSDYANSLSERTDVLLLLGKLRELFM